MRNVKTDKQIVEFLKEKFPLINMEDEELLQAFVLDDDGKFSSKIYDDLELESHEFLHPENPPVQSSFI